jgi:hypothetical protein
MDDKTFDNVARRLGGLRSRRAALKTAGGAVAAAVFTALGRENSALAEDGVSIENHCKARRVTCEKPKECCGYRRKRKHEIVCKPIPGLSGTRCCGQNKASCFADDDCCQLYECNQNTLECQLIP